MDSVINANGKITHPVVTEVRSSFYRAKTVHGMNVPKVRKMSC